MMINIDCCPGFHIYSYGIGCLEYKSRIHFKVYWSVFRPRPLHWGLWQWVCQGFGIEGLGWLRVQAVEGLRGIKGGPKP